MKNTFRIFGFDINIKKFLIGAGIYAAVILVLFALWKNGIDISWYGVLMGTGFLLAVIIASELAKERGIYKDFSYDIIWFVFPLSIIGARVAYVINALDEFNSFVDMLKIWEGGLSILGGVIGGTIGLLLFCVIKRINPIKTMDVVAPVLILGQAIGRWGNFINKEVYGWEITNDALKWFPFGVNIDGTWHLANFFYESVLDLIGFFVLTIILRKSKKTGMVVSTYLVWYGVVRSCLELLRAPQYILYIPNTSIPFSFVTSLLYALIGIIGFIIIAVKKAKKT